MQRPNVLPNDDESDASSHHLLQPRPHTPNEPHQYLPDTTSKPETCDCQQSLTGEKSNGGLMIQEVPGHSSNKTDQTPSRKTNIVVAWSFEILLLLLALALLVAVFLILNKYNKQEIPNWKILGITLNALIAVLATIIRAIIALVAFEVLSQLKWDWIMGRFRPMQDLQLFDDASRGIYGSLRLLPVIALHQPLAIGAIVIAIVSLSIGPITQQAIQTYECQRSGHQSPHILIAKTVDREKIVAWVGMMSDSKLKVGMKSAMQDSMLNPSNSSNIGSLFSCSSGNCTFPTYADNPEQPEDERISHASAGMCSRCEDVSELVQGPFVEGLARGYRLPTFNSYPPAIVLGTGPNPATRVYLSVNGTGNLTWARQVVPVDFINQARWSVSNFSMIAASQANCDHLPDGNISCPHFNDQPIGVPEGVNSSRILDALAWNKPVDYVAATCILYPCLRYYAASIRNGVLSEKVVRSVALRQGYIRAMPAAIFYTGVTDWHGIQQPCLVNGTLYTSSNMSSSANLGPNATVTVVDHSKDWIKEDIDLPERGINVTAPPECVVTLSHPVLRAFQNEMDRTFTTNCSLSRYGENIQCGGDSDSPSSHIASLLHNRTTSIDTIRETIDSMARRITTEMRLVGYGSSVRGQTWENKVCIHVAWAWLTLPTTLLVLSVLLVAGVILKETLSKDKMVWKSSILPILLMHCLDVGNSGLERLNKLAEGFQVKLERDTN